MTVRCLQMLATEKPVTLVQYCQHCISSNRNVKEIKDYKYGKNKPDV